MRLSTLPALFFLSLPVFATAQESSTEATTADGDANVEIAEGDAAANGEEENALQPSDGLAECAAILEVASSRSSNLIERRRMQNAALMWLTTSDSVAQAEGLSPDDAAWNAKLAQWSTRIGGVSSLSKNADWMNYCAKMGKEHGLGSEIFEQHSS